MEKSFVLMTLTLAVLAATTINSHAQEEISIDFDDLSAPCDFGSALPLRDEYAAQGIHFHGSNDEAGGGAVLGECSGYGISGFSQPNFVAVDASQILGNGDFASGPLTISFDEHPYHIKLLVGGQPGAVAILECVGSPWEFPLVTGSVVLSESMTVLEAWSDYPINVRCYIETTAGPFIVDDLRIGYQPPSAPVPIDGNTAAVVLSLLVLASGLLVLRKQA